MAGLLERLGIELPVVQAGMGGGLAGHELAAAVSEAGGLGTIAAGEPSRLREEIAAFRSSTGRPLAVNLLLPFVGDRHWEAAAYADLIVTFWGAPQRRTGGTWIHQCGSVAEALAAHSAGADAVIAQGVEAGGHVRGTQPALDLLASVRAALPGDYPVLVAGGIADAGDVTEALAAGGEAAVAGTRFVLAEECRAHPGYKQRLVEANDTVLTELFGLGWPAPHRVVANEATERWLGSDPRGPGSVRALNRALTPLTTWAPEALYSPLVGAQRARVPLLTPAPPRADEAPGAVESRPLYAGKTVARLGDVRPAASIVRELAG